MPTVQKTKCLRCSKTLKETEFYKAKAATDELPDGVFPVCKTCIGNTYKASEPASFMHILYYLDMPWLPSKYKDAYEKKVTASKPNPLAALGQYIMTMKLNQYKAYGFFQSEELQERFEGKVTDPIDNYQYKIPLDKVVPYMQKEQNTIFKIPENEEDYIIQEENEDGEVVKPANSVSDITSGITEAEHMFLKLKWGTGFHISELIRLEKMYQEMLLDYDIRTSTHKDHLRKICKVSIRLDGLLEEQDFDGAKKASDMYDKLNKAAGLQPTQGQSEDNFLDATGYLVKMCEEEGPIPVYDINANPDEADIILKDFKLYIKKLVSNDDTIYDRHQIAMEELAKQDELLLNGEVLKEGEEDEGNIIDKFNKDYEDLEEDDD